MRKKIVISKKAENEIEREKNDRIEKENIEKQKQNKRKEKV